MTKSQQIILPLPNGPIKQLLLLIEGSELQSISMDFEQKKLIKASATIPANISDITQQLCQYSEQAHNNWSIALPKSGTEFQRRVWQYLQTIPMGTTQSYGEVAKALSSSARAVGNACRANPYLLVVPCHRVVKSIGIGGFGGKVDEEAIAIKQWLLAHERE
jgi:methylated-DNA-[protein]-cysteine S-methyltransferase